MYRIVPFRLGANHALLDGSSVPLPERVMGKSPYRLEVRWSFLTPSVLDLIKEERGIQSVFKEETGIQSVIGSMVGKGAKVCVVYMELYVGALLTIRGEDVRAWKSLAGLEEVVFRVRWMKMKECGGLFGFGSFLLGRSERRKRDVLTTVERALDGALGSAKHGDDEEGDYVRFKPTGEGKEAVGLEGEERAIESELRLWTRTCYT